MIVPIIALASILLSISFYGQFSWTENALSDLGVKSGLVAPIFNLGIVVSGVLTVVFAAGLYEFFHQETVGRIGSFILGLAALALMSIGIFPENVKPTHYYSSVAFFAFFPISMLAFAVAFIQGRKMKLGLFTLAVAFIAALPWIVQFVQPYVPNVAIPEAISATSAAAWAVVLGFNMLRTAAQPRI
ncbi:MAG TPA: DUF998 domain-containing protein [Candidatus Acidoferrum sp.]|nr:DUF998 domain-containing protein [Candidatus Acidoferrum sp.]